MSLDLALAWNPASGRADLQVARGALVTEDGLRSAVILSLMTDGRARDDDDPADGDGGDATDRRGWWGDLGAPSPIGSRLWLLRRAKATEATRLRAEGMAREALAWMVQDGLCERLDLRAELQGAPPDRLAFRVTLVRGGAADRFILPWQLELSR